MNNNHSYSNYTSTTYFTNFFQTNHVAGAAALASSSGSGFVGKEGKFKVTKMRCWRIMTLASVVEAEESPRGDVIDSETVIADRYF